MRQNESDPQRWAAIVLSVPGPLRDLKLADVICQKTVFLVKVRSDTQRDLLWPEPL